MYLNGFDHFVKETLRVSYYIRYTDDFVFLHENPVALASLLPIIRRYLFEELALDLHPNKIILTKLKRGIDFLGYVVLPHHRVLRTKTKRRMWKALMEWDRNDFAPVESYRGMLKQCNGYAIDKKIREFTNYDECWKYGVMFPF